MPRPGEPPLGAGESSRCRAPPRSPTRSSMRPACGFASRRSRRRRCVLALDLCAARQDGGASSDAAAGAAAARCRSHRWKNRIRWPARRLWRRLPRSVLAVGRRRPACSAGGRDRADRAAGPVDLLAPPPSSAAACSPRSATARSATPRRAASSTPAAARWKRRSAPSTPPTSRPTSTPASAVVVQRLPARDARRRLVATDGISTRRFPYTAFAKTSDDDLQALYAYFMAQPAVRAETPRTDWRFRSTCGR